jgi:hypothetical protein
MALVWIAFIASALLIGGSAWHLVRRARGAVMVDAAKKPFPWQWDPIFLFVGALGVLSTVPGLFFGQPHWAIDHVWWLISRVVA